MKSLIGKEVRRITFTLNRGGKYYLLFCVMEELFPDFQDFYDFRDKFVCERISHTSKNTKDKIYFSIDFFTITEEFLKEPNKNFILQDEFLTPVICEGIYRKLPEGLHNFWIINHLNQNKLLKALPERVDTRYIYEWKDISFVIPTEVLKSTELLNQLAQLSYDHYGVNLAHHMDSLGKIYLIRYNPYYRNLEILASFDPAGIYVEIDGIRSNDKLKIEFINKTKDEIYQFSNEFELDLSQSNHFFELSGVPDRIEIIVKDMDGNIVDAVAPIPFIKGLHVNMEIASSHLSITHRNGQNEKVEKFVSETFGIAHEDNEESKREELISIYSAKEAYETLEKALEFAFFDGSKIEAEKEKNKIKASDFVKNILRRARQKCIVADPYFNLNDLSHYIFTMPQSEVTVRILGSKEYLNRDYGEQRSAEKVRQEREDIKKSIQGYKRAYPSFDVQFKLLKGDKSPLHDRYIMVDDDVWMVGTSFNEIGSRASSIIKLPKASARRISEQLESWWSDSEFSETI